MPDDRGTAGESQEIIGDEIRQFRRARGLTLVQLADAIGKTPGFLSQIERGLAKPSLKTLQAMGRALDVNVSWFFEHEGAAPGEASRLIVRADNRRRLRYEPLEGSQEDLNFEDRLLSPHLDGSFFVDRTLEQILLRRGGVILGRTSRR